MTIPSAEIDDYATVTLDGSGNGTARITPGQSSGGGAAPGRNSGYSWSVDTVYVSVATNVLESKATLYVSYGIISNGPNDGLGTTQQGSTGDTCTVGRTLRPGDWITVVWKGGDAGQVATAKVFGTVNFPGGM